MVSILTLTYHRYELLEEAIHSYLLQYEPYKHESEMVIVNDSPNVEYVFVHPNIRIFNLKKRFSSIGKKLQWGFSQCRGDWVYRLDDDDLLSPYALEINKLYRTDHYNKDIIRDSGHYFFSDNKFISIKSSVNNGNCYHINYINRVGDFIDRSWGEDNWLTFENNANIYTGDLEKYTMIYRWGMSTYHISVMNKYDNEYILSKTDEYSKKENGIIYLSPKFRNDYWSYI